MNKELEDDNFLNYQFLLQQFFGCLVRIYGFIINCQQLDMQYFRGLEPAGSRYHLDEAQQFWGSLTVLGSWTPPEWNLAVPKAIYLHQVTKEQRYMPQDSSYKLLIDIWSKVWVTNDFDEQLNLRLIKLNFIIFKLFLWSHVYDESNW